MTETTLRSALDGARVVEFHPTRDLFVAWSGGITFNVYACGAFGSERGRIQETTCFSLSDDRGRPVDAETAREHAKEWLARSEAEL